MNSLLSFENVTKRQRDAGRELEVLKGVSFELREGASLGVYGERRSGKSTLLRLAVGIELPDEGRVRFQGRELPGMSDAERAGLLRGPVALLTAEGFTASPRETVMDHVAMSLGSSGLSLREARQRALEALDRVGVAGVGVREMTVSLSLSERARVMLARALARDPRLLVVDEPAPLPSLSERERFCALLRTVARERSIALLVASEDLSALQGLSEIASLSAGELCTAREPASVIDLPLRRAGMRERS